MRAFFLLLFASAMLTACVSSKKYNALLENRDYYQNEYKALKVVEEEKQKLESENAVLNAQLRQNTKSLEEATVKIQSLDRSYQDLLKRYDDLLQQNKTLLQSSSSEIKSLTETLSKQRDELDMRSRSLDSLQRELEKRENILKDWESKIGELQEALSAKDAKVAELRNKVNQALLGFTAAELTVTERDGKLYVSLSQNLLFKSGSDQIDVKGKQAIQQLAQVLSANPDIEITVEGHTDTDGTAEYNWDLSVSRATSVVKILAGNGVDQKRMTAAGRSFFVPLVPNTTAENKSKNRRVDIILSPKLDELLQIIRS